jgi:hypothetical protein
VLVLPDSEEAMFHLYAESSDESHALSIAHDYTERLAEVIAEAGGATGA